MIKQPSIHTTEMLPFGSSSRALYGLFRPSRNTVLESLSKKHQKQGFRLFVVSAASGQPQVMLVESPAKAQKIQSYLGDDYKVIASYGHIRDLLPKPGSVDPTDDFKMQWSLKEGAEPRVQEILTAVKDCSQLVLATDPDREGEAISWHLLQEIKARKGLKDDTPAVRITFTEVTKPAILEALASPREVSEPLVEAYMARRALDYLYGFSLSPLLWQKLPGARSAGRVQSVALRLVSEREAAIEGFIPQEYWSIEANVLIPTNGEVHANLIFADGSAPPQPGYLDKAQAKMLADRVASTPFMVANVTVKQTSRNPAAPFTTSTLQQEANKRLGMSASRTMQLAQKLYEAGHITYMRTDGVNVAPSAITSLRDAVEQQYGPEYLTDQPRVYASRSKNAQEAHEAIRPTDPNLLPDSLGNAFEPSAIKLYQLIRARFFGSQMTSAKIEQVGVDFLSSDGSLKLRSTASRVAFAGYLAAYSSQSNLTDTDIESDTEEDDGKDRMSEAARQRATTALAALKQGDVVSIVESKSVDHETRPPGRYTEGTLVKALEEQGIGRPSTYAPTLRLLQTRRYIRKEGRALHAEPLGRVLTGFLQSYFDKYVDYDFTSNMEEKLDDITDGGILWRDVLNEFWGPFSDKVKDAKGLTGTEVLDALNTELATMLFGPEAALLASENGTEDAEVAARVVKARQCPSCGGQLSLKLSHKGGPFVGCGNYPVCSYARPVNDIFFGSDDEEDTDSEGSVSVSDGAPELSDNGETAAMRNRSEVADRYGMRGIVRVIGSLPNGKELFARQGPYGPYIQVGLDTDPEMRRVPLPKSANVRNITVAYATSLVQLPRILGQHPETRADVIVKNGRFGPYISHGNDSRSVPKDVDPVTLELEKALELLSQAKGRAKKKMGEKEANKIYTKFMKKSKDSDKDLSEEAESIAAETESNAKLTSTKPDFPRSRSAYNMFLKSYMARPHEEVFAEIQAKGLTAMSLDRKRDRVRLGAAIWNALSDEQREVYVEEARQDKLRFEVQKAGILPEGSTWQDLDQATRDSLVIQAKEKKEKVINTVKKVVKKKKGPNSGYSVFVQESTPMVKELMAEQGKMGVKGKFMFEMSRLWRALTDEQRIEYTERAKMIAQVIKSE